jgi:hypothetical protein
MALVDIGIRIAQFTVISADAERGWMAMTRLIDADAIDAIRASASKYTGFMEMEMYTDDDAVEAINSVPSAEPHWIPCSDRLPEKDGYYLTTTCYRQVYCDFWNEDHFDRTEAVIAWMPLPKPYEVEDEKTD